MSVIIAFLVFAAAASLAGGVAIVAYRQKALKELKGEASFSTGEKAREFWVYVKKGILKANGAFVKNRRYGQVLFLLKKLNMDDKLDRESFLFMEEAAVLSAFLIGHMLFNDMLFSLALSLGAYFVPWLMLKSKARQKDDAVLRELPDALDIIAANIEGGLSLNQAVSRYAVRNRNVFSDELLHVIKTMQLGKSSEDALRELDVKLEMKDVSSFINAYLQAEKMGGNVKKIIKDQAEEVRKRRFQHLKKLAHEAPVKLLIPLMIFIFPVIFIVLFGPIVIKVMQGF